MRCWWRHSTWVPVHAHMCMCKGHSSDSNRQQWDIGLCCYAICMYCSGEYCRVAIVVEEAVEGLWVHSLTVPALFSYQVYWGQCAKYTISDTREVFVTINQKRPTLMHLMHKILFSFLTVHKCMPGLRGSSQMKLAKRLLITSMFRSEERNNAILSNKLKTS